MASMIVRRMDELTKTRLRARAARHGRSMEEEAREILKAALATNKTGQRNLAESIRRRFGPRGGVELPAVSREPLRQPLRFGK